MLKLHYSANRRERFAKNSLAEVDYLIHHKSWIVPVEVKAGTTGTLRSLHYFMGLRNLSTAIRINSDYPSITPVNVMTQSGEQVSYQLLSIPFYLVSEMHRLLDKELRYS